MHFWRSYHRRQWDFGTSGEPFRHAEAELELRTLASGRESFSKLFVKFFVLVVRTGEPAFDEEIADFSLHFERVSGCNDQVRQFSLFDGPQLIGQSEYLRGILHYGLQSFVMGQTVPNCCSGILREPARKRCAKTGK